MLAQLHPPWNLKSVLTDAFFVSKERAGATQTALRCVGIRSPQRCFCLSEAKGKNREGRPAQNSRQRIYAGRFSLSVELKKRPYGRFFISKERAGAPQLPLQADWGSLPPQYLRRFVFIVPLPYRISSQTKT